MATAATKKQPLTAKERKERWLARHPERAKAQARQHSAAYAETHVDAARVRKALWYAANKEARRLRQTAYRQEQRAGVAIEALTTVSQ